MNYWKVIKNSNFQSNCYVSNDYSHSGINSLALSVSNNNTIDGYFGITFNGKWKIEDMSRILAWIYIPENAYNKITLTKINLSELKVGMSIFIEESIYEILKIINEDTNSISIGVKNIDTNEIKFMEIEKPGELLLANSYECKFRSVFKINRNQYSAEGKLIKSYRIESIEEDILIGRWTPISIGLNYNIDPGDLGIYGEYSNLSIFINASGTYNGNVYIDDICFYSKFSSLEYAIENYLHSSY